MAEPVKVYKGKLSKVVHCKEMVGKLLRGGWKLTKPDKGKTDGRSDANSGGN